ncbi:PRC-barrel domain-containing protein, partial [Kineococcus sp. SYSU DK006]|uniref:PRC-barrel domain-containing protein n=1 Tax=Kineococcus sp. SYSU DK006 TaxID=3383127 RepID=UPI003D7D394C
MLSGLTTIDDLYSATVYGTDGDKIGKVEDVYLDNATSQPEWVSVKTGLFGSNISLIPLSQGSFSGDRVEVPFDKAKVKDAPHHDPGRELSETDEQELYRYYGVGYSSSSSTDTTTTGTTADFAGGGTTGMTGEHATSTTGVTGTTGTGTTGRTETAGTTGMTDRTDTVGHDTSGPNTDNAMTRSKEELRVGTETREAGRARLRKHIVSERVSRTVPVSHE